MSISFAPSISRFVYTSHKHLVSNPEIKWVNRYDFFSPNVADNLIMVHQQITEALNTFEKMVHLTSVALDYMTVSTYEEDSDSYNGNEFLNIPLENAGQLGPTSDPLPLNVVLHIQRTTESGFPGKLFLRGCLEEYDIQSVGGYPRLFTSALWISRIGVAVSASNLDNYMQGGTGPLYMCVGKDLGSQTQLVLGLGRPRVAFNKTKRRVKRGQDFTA